LAGLYELIQRDGFFIYWLNHQPPPRLDLTTIDYQPIKEVYEECQRYGLELALFDTTSDINIPSCLAVLMDKSEQGIMIVCGGSCGSDWRQILLRSIMESFSVYHWIRNRKEDMSSTNFFSDEDYQPFQDKRINQAARLLIWGGQKMTKNFNFFLTGKVVSFNQLMEKSLNFSSDQEELNYLVNKFKSFSQDYLIYYYQAKHQALNDLGYFSVKVIVPAFFNLYLNEIYAPLGTKRLKEVPVRLGFKPAEKWNPWPHPFP
jgi:ribosomal protein S12 methylthiotransferase accessory factor